MPVEKFNSLNDAKKIYPKLIPNRHKKSVKTEGDRVYIYYGTLYEKHGIGWRINRMFQLFGASFFFPLAFCKKNYRSFLSRKFNEIRNPNQSIECYILQQPGEKKENGLKNNPRDIMSEIFNPAKKPIVQKDTPEIKSEIKPKEKEDTIQEPKNNPDSEKKPIQDTSEKPEEIKDQNAVRKSEDKPDSEEKPTHLIEIPKESTAPNPMPEEQKKPEIQKNIPTIQDKFNLIQRKMADNEIKADEQNEIFDFFNSLSPQEFELIAPEIIQLNHSILEKVPLNFLPLLFQVTQKQLENNIIDDKKYEDFWTDFFEHCETINRFISIMKCFAEENKILNDKALQIINRKGKINDFVKLADLPLIKEYLNKCDDHTIYFALKQALINQNKYQPLLETLDQEPKNRMTYVESTGFKFPHLPLDTKFHTQITDKDGNEVKVTMYDTQQKYKNSRTYQLKNEQNKLIGEIFLESKEDYLLIEDMESFSKKEGVKLYHHVGRALHEFAVHESFKRNLEGHVRIKARTDQDGFLYRLGYRYVDLAPTYAGLDKVSLEAIEKYFKEKNEQKPTHEIIKEIEELFKETDDHIFKDFRKPNYQRFKLRARKALKREPKNMEEILDYGFYIDKNKYMKKALALDPLRHPKLGPLILEYQKLRAEGRKIYWEEKELIDEHAKKEDEIVQKIKDLKNDPNEKELLEKILKKLNKNAVSKLQEKPTLEQKFIHGIKKTVNYGGWMFLSDEAIEKWKQILENLQ